ncbi:MAG: hypothetical protein ACFFAU_00470 [Candidatus Hodarchaeota archaeon]
MQKKSRDVEVETLKTPKGDVVTIKGLQSAINSVYKEISSLDQHLAQINSSLNQINAEVSEYNQKIGFIGESLASLITYLAKFESEQKNIQEMAQKQQIITKTDLLALKEELSSILDRLQDKVSKSE